MSIKQLEYRDIETQNNEDLINSGDICEQFTGQHLLYSKDSFFEPELYYWQKEQKNSSAEIDYVISEGSSIIPLEVKSEKTGRLKSLHR